MPDSSGRPRKGIAPGEVAAGDGHVPRPCGGQQLSPAAYLPPSGLYLHIPFCRAKCSYCDFASYALSSELYAPYVEALAAEVRAVGSQWQPAELETVYIGGGTPTVVPGALLRDLLEIASRAFSLPTGAEVTVEANPGTVSPGELALLRQAGVNRLSFGVQSFQAPLLRLLGRIHSAQEAVEAVRMARDAGFDNLNLDLIYGLPGQALAQWQADLDAALALAPEHLSLYALSLEPGTPLATRVSCRELPAPEADLAADMYELARRRLARAGYEHYELSNWARERGRRARHNLAYWLNMPYAGCGAAAHSWLGGQRRANVGTPQEYIGRIRGGRHPVAEEECVSPELERAETMILGLRLLEGVSRPGFEARFGVDPAQLYAQAIAEGESLGLLEVKDRQIRLSERGLLLGNEVFWRFLP